MLEVANMGLHVAQMTGVEDIKACFAAVTTNAAEVLHLPDYGIAPGCNADFLVLQAADPIEAVRLHATRLYVFRRGRVLAEAPAAESTIRFGQTVRRIDFTRENIKEA